MAVLAVLLFCSLAVTFWLMAADREEERLSAARETRVINEVKQRTDLLKDDAEGACKGFREEPYVRECAHVLQKTIPDPPGGWKHGISEDGCPPEYPLSAHGEAPLDTDLKRAGFAMALCTWLGDNFQPDIRYVDKNCVIDIRWQEPK